MPLSSTKPWSAAKASTWMRRYADELAKDALATGEDWMWSCAGAAYHAVLHGVGYNTREEFIEYLSTHIRVPADSLLITEAVEEIER